MKTLRSLLLSPLLVPLAVAAAPLPDAPAAADASMVSFAELYRLTVHAEPFAWQAPSAKTEVRAVSQRVVPELHFAVSAPHDGSRWALLLAGLAACAWVAHRRLASPY